MVKRFLAYLRAVPAFVARVKSQPVLVATLAFIAFQAYQQAAASSLGTEDIFIAVGEAIVGWLASQLVVPVVKVDAAVRVLLDQPQERLPLPYLGEGDE